MIFMIIKTWQELINEIKQADGDIYVAGAGNIGRIFGDYLNKNKIEWKGFLDKRAIEGAVCEKSVYPYEIILQNENAYVIVSSQIYSKEICEKLKTLGLRDRNIFSFEKDDISIAFDLLNETCHVYDILERLNVFKDKHEDRRGFVIGNGPSLKIDDLEKLRDEITFGCNGVYALYDHTKWRPTYYVTQDATSIKALKREDVRQKVRESEAIFTNLFSYYYINDYGDKLDNVYFYKNKQGVDEIRLRANFSDDISQLIYNAGTISYVMLQLAIYMGIKEIYLLGIDFSFSADKKLNGEIVKQDVIDHNEIIEKEEAKNYSLHKKLFNAKYMANTEYQLMGYQAAKRYADAHGIKIYNATRGGKLEVFPRVDFDTLF